MTDQRNGRPRVLLIGLQPETVDLTDAPIDLAELRARIAAGNAAVAAAGFDVVACQIGLDAAEGTAAVREALEATRFDAVMVGGGIRTVMDHTVLFEGIVNVVHELAPDSRIAFNAGPDTTLDALSRVLGG